MTEIIDNNTESKVSQAQGVLRSAVPLAGPGAVMLGSTAFGMSGAVAGLAALVAGTYLQTKTPEERSLYSKLMGGSVAAGLAVSAGTNALGVNPAIGKAVIAAGLAATASTAVYNAVDKAHLAGPHSTQTMQIGAKTGIALSAALAFAGVTNLYTPPEAPLPEASAVPQAVQLQQGEDMALKQHFTVAENGTLSVNAVQPASSVHTLTVAKLSR